VPHNVDVDSAWGTALIAFAATILGAAISLFGGRLQQKRGEQVAEANRRTVLRETGLERIAEELFAIIRHEESIPHQHTPAHEHLAWEKTLREHLTRIEMATLRLDDLELLAVIHDMCSLIKDWDRLQPAAWPREVVTGAPQHAIASIRAHLTGMPLPRPGRDIQKLRAAREAADEYERVAAEETRLATEEMRRNSST
jgi:ADP-ribose pyrophosphatase YjhB (NUDIX family)